MSAKPPPPLSMASCSQLLRQSGSIHSRSPSAITFMPKSSEDGSPGPATPPKSMSISISP